MRRPSSRVKGTREELMRLQTPIQETDRLPSCITP
jgi:hypothetical protein